MAQLSGNIHATDEEFLATGEAQLLELPKGYLSHSQINLFLSCPRRYYYRYILGRQGKSGSNVNMGGYVHAVLEEVLTAYRDAGYEKPPIGFVHDTASDLLKEFIPKVDYWEGELASTSHPHKRFEEEARELIMLFYHERLGQLRPRLLEHRIEFVIQSKLPDDRVIAVPFVGYADIIDRDIEAEKGFGFTSNDLRHIQPSDVIRDIKVTGKKYHKDKVHKSLQLSLYALGERLSKVGYDLLIRRGKRAPVRFAALPDSDGHTGVSFRTRGELEWAAQVAIDIALSISKGNFPRTEPESWVCNPKWCDHFNECRGRHEAQFRVRPMVIVGRQTAREKARQEQTGDAQPEVAM